jgi:hypothetical protein
MNRLLEEKLELLEDIESFQEAFGATPIVSALDKIRRRIGIGRPGFTTKTPFQKPGANVPRAVPGATNKATGPKFKGAFSKGGQTTPKPPAGGAGVPPYGRKPGFSTGLNKYKGRRQQSMNLGG